MVKPSAALFASLSASLLPSNPLCPAVHHTMSLYVFLFFCLVSMLAIQTISCTKWCLGLLIVDLKALIVHPECKGGVSPFFGAY